MRPEPVVALYTDAGVKNGVGTWATVAIVHGLDKPIEASGKFRAGVKCTVAGELQAIANALHRLIKLGYLEFGAEVLVVSDSQHALERIAGVTPRRKREEPEKALAVVVSTAQAHGIKLSTQWVKGHQPLTSRDPHAVHNRRCDKLCRDARNAEPKSVKRNAQRKAAKVRLDIAATPPSMTKARKALETARRLATGA